MKTFILLLSGPSGSGKSTLLRKLFDEFENELYFSISSTTRTKRADEVDGVHYHFITHKEFKESINKGDFLEWAKVHENYYGTSLKNVQQALNNGKTVIFDIDTQGFHITKHKLKERIVTVFITTKNKKELEKRLLKRNTDTIKDLQKRLENANTEMAELEKYDYLIINEDLQQSYEALKSIFIVQKLRTQNQDIEQIKNLWNKGE
ncbi:guanylate kinase [Campylobacter sp. MIT 21-1685]|uniref:guanylate kinase n=1 Tax=unclassified Campylobacter TaxID=2593542 RepID=UPI00224A70D1|nr:MULTISPECIES: guanylate kinase [unclassified Campylobacter]MCX2683852.1 guanylate kinase [Campylobacter sp. MIT 21-1684]MCX2752136.1 guanylate kinase [Campylobacter sp. MIT 21-1682]MCX2808329.1 guanylate kinase [Campylobacter sp. MIT 21-1685]